MPTNYHSPIAKICVEQSRPQAVNDVIKTFNNREFAIYSVNI